MVYWNIRALREFRGYCERERVGRIYPNGVPQSQYVLAVPEAVDRPEGLAKDLHDRAEVLVK